jgi:ABC-2 type transport system permease protein
MSTDISRPVAAAAQSSHLTPTKAVRPFYWSLRRELWEHRSLYLAPAVIALFLVLALVIAAFMLPPSMAGFDTFAPQKQLEIVSAPYSMIALVLMLTAMVVVLFYCLDALYGERRDRSALFWKSLPVSDWTTVLAKLAVPMLVLPVFLFVLITATQLVVLIGHVLLWSVRGLSVSNLLLQMPLLDMPLGVAHFLITLAIWYAPVYAWLLLVSAWAQRSPVVWAIVPWVAVVAFERLVLGTSRVGGWLRERFFGNFDAAFTSRETLAEAVERMQQPGADVANAVRHGSDHTPDVLRFLSNPNVWIGLVFAAALIVATVWLRRRQESQST